jgi:hypothetical protein
MATRVQFENNNEIGVFSRLTNAYCLVRAPPRPLKRPHTTCWTFCSAVKQQPMSTTLCWEGHQSSTKPAD